MLNLLSINLGNVHFVSFADFMVRGVGMTALAVFLIYIGRRCIHDWRNIDWDEPFEEFEEEN